MTFNFSEAGTVIIGMKEYLNEILSGLTEDMNGATTTPVSDHSCKTRSNVPTLNKERA